MEWLRNEETRKEQNVSFVFSLASGAIRLFHGKMTTVWEMPYDGEPCVFCPNHSGAMGPIAMCVYFEGREKCHPWYSADAADRKKLPGYVRQDYWWKPGCKLEPLYNVTVPYLAALLMPPLFKGISGIPVYYDIQVVKTYRESLAWLKKGENIVIFPEHSTGYDTHADQLSRGFLRVAPLAWKQLGIKLKFYPVHTDGRTIWVKAPVCYDPEIPLEEQEEKLLTAIMDGLSHP